MRHDMDLYEPSFEAIRSGAKTIEMRLNDEKRQKIRVDDLVFFHSRANEYDVLRCKVKSLRKYADFYELYPYYDKKVIGYSENEKADPADMYAYYRKEDIERYGALAIEVELLDDIYLCDGHMHLEYGPLNKEYALQFIEEGIRKGLDEVDILDHTHRFKEFKECYDHLRIYEKQDEWLNKPTKFCSSLAEYYDLIKEIRQLDLPIRVKFGLEVCYTSNTEELLKEILKDVKLDFLTGAIHSIDSILYDMSFSRELLWDIRDPDEIYKRYYEEVLALVRSGLFDRLAHPDQIKLLNIYPAYDLSETYEKIAEALKQKDMYGENNSGIRYRYGHHDLGTGEELLKAFGRHGVGIICASDAHKPEDVGTLIYENTLRNKEVI
ncbi:MAG: ASCH domain-containing protein [Erysipelotrichaceae bacterium]|nr:ASCH domain-containing protein [Erysipelotrichaceae bacterium]